MYNIMQVLGHWPVGTVPAPVKVYKNCMCIYIAICCTYLTRKAISVYVMLRALTILCTVMYVNFFKLIPVGQRSTRYVNMLFCVLIYTKYQRLSRIVQNTGNLWWGKIY